MTRGCQERVAGSRAQEARHEAHRQLSLWSDQVRGRDRRGVTCFLRGHLPELGGDYVAIYLNTLDDLDPSTIQVMYWDGRHDNWEAGPRDTPWPFTPASAASPG